MDAVAFDPLLQSQLYVFCLADFPATCATFDCLDQSRLKAIGHSFACNVAGLFGRSSSLAVSVCVIGTIGIVVTVIDPRRQIARARKVAAH